MKLFVCPPRESLWDDYPYIYNIDGFVDNKSDICDAPHVKILDDIFQNEIRKEIDKIMLEEIMKVARTFRGKEIK